MPKQTDDPIFPPAKPCEGLVVSIRRDGDRAVIHVRERFPSRAYLQVWEEPPEYPFEVRREDWPGDWPIPLALIVTFTPPVTRTRTRKRADGTLIKTAITTPGRLVYHAPTPGIPVRAG